MNSASELYRAMLRDVVSGGYMRESSDKVSPLQVKTVEAEFGLSYTLRSPSLNVVACRRVDLRWAAANLLHFFACTEDAGVLRNYNRHADRFLTDDRLVGAYGPIAVPQIETCIQLLKSSPQSRRAVVSMGPLGYQDQNQPPCWSMLHFLVQKDRLHLFVYQRSLNLTGVMPYDCVLLTNTLLYAAERLGVPADRLHWTVGSLHAPVDSKNELPESGVQSIVYPAAVLGDPHRCLKLLEDGV